MNPLSLILICCTFAALLPFSVARQYFLKEASGQVSAPSGGLEKVLDKMDATAAGFHAAQADFVWDQYQKVINETDTQKGRVYFRRQGKDLQMMAEISSPNHKYVLYSGGKVQIYEPPPLDRVTVYQPKDRAAVEGFLVLGFGGRGHDLQQQFDVKYLGTETLNGVETAKLDLVPKSARVRGMFDHILVWIDMNRGVALQQQMFESSGDYRLSKYSDIQLLPKLPDNIFKLKTTGKTTTVSPQG